MYTNTDLFDAIHTIAAPLFEQYTYPWEILPHIKDFVSEMIVTLLSEHPDEYTLVGENVLVSKLAKIAPTALLTGPAIIGPSAEIRHCAFFRGSIIVGAGAVVGNSTELKNVILFDGVQVPHYNYVGDSILGYKAHMGAGAITSNVKADKSLVMIKSGDEQIETGIKKVGAFLGDHAEIGCNSVLNPGAVIGHDAQVYPLSNVRGVVPANSIYKRAGEVAVRR
jgi:NDP-sugar pyrophosphorylase family protein